MIEIKGVTKKYGTATIIKNINLKVDDSSVLGIAGFNGCGKTTLLNICAGILKADKGQVFFDGEPTFQNDTVRSRMFYVSDSMWYPVGATVKISAKYYATYYPNFDFKLLKSLCELFSLDDKKSVKSFSKGMIRQVSLCIALASRPEYLLIDESFDGLDPQKKDAMKKLLLEYINETRCSVIITSHNLNEISELCDHVAIINGSSVILDSSIDDISNSFRKLTLQFNGEADEKFLENISYSSYKPFGKQAQIIITGDINKELEKIKALPIEIIDSQSLTLEEVFSQETEAKSNDEKIKQIFK